MALKRKTFLSDLDCWNQVLEEESSLWVKDIISHYNLDEKIVFGKDSGKAIDYLIQNKFHIEYNLKNKGIKILNNKNIVGEWNVASIVTKVDDEKNPFVEIAVDILSVKGKELKLDKNYE